MQPVPLRRERRRPAWWRRQLHRPSLKFLTSNSQCPPASDGGEGARRSRCFTTKVFRKGKLVKIFQ